MSGEPVCEKTSVASYQCQYHCMSGACVLHDRRTTDVRGHRWCEVCEAGKIGITDACVACEPGKFNDGISRTCDNCPQDTYANSSGQTACTACPAGERTLLSGAKAQQDCLCIEGTSGITGNCQTCPIGKYSVRPGVSSCTQCAEHRSTAAMGARSRDSCLCVPGVSLSATSCAFSLLCLVSLLRFCVRLSLIFETKPLLNSHAVSGFYQNQVGVCTQCGEGTFSDLLGNQQCRQVRKHRSLLKISNPMSVVQHKSTLFSRVPALE